MKNPCVYIISNVRRTTLYIGLTNNIERRMLEHKSGLGSAFAKKYNLCDLLYYENLPSMNDAITREKQLKNWHSQWKWNLIRKENSGLKDLSADWFIPKEIEDFKKEMKEGYGYN